MNFFQLPLKQVHATQSHSLFNIINAVSHSYVSESITQTWTVVLVWMSSAQIEGAIGDPSFQQFPLNYGQGKRRTVVWAGRSWLDRRQESW